MGGPTGFDVPISINAFFFDASGPKTGLTPHITIMDSDTLAVVVNAGVMSEIGMGHYKYTYDLWDHDKKYVWTIDGGASLDAEKYRYKYNCSDGQVETWIRVRHFKRAFLAPYASHF